MEGLVESSYETRCVFFLGDLVLVFSTVVPQPFHFHEFLAFHFWS